MGASLSNDALMSTAKDAGDGLSFRATPREAAIALLGAEASARLELEWEVTPGQLARASKDGKVLIEVSKRGRELVAVMLAPSPWPARLHIAALHGFSLLLQPRPPIDTSRGRVPIGNRKKVR